MSKQNYLYQLIRYVPDLERMEPRNLGVIVQSEAGVTCRIWPRFNPGELNPDFDTVNFRKWREFFDAEVNGPQIALFQPPRASVEFLEYLRSKCKGNYLLSQPLHVAMDTESIDEVQDYLYEKLVRSPAEEAEPAEQVVRRFREQLEARKLEKYRPFRRDEYVDLPDGSSVLFHWHYTRNHGSNEKVLIEKVQCLGRIRLTQVELEHALTATHRVRESRIPARIMVVMDGVDPPSEHAQDSTKRLYDNYLKGREQMRGSADEVIGTVEAAETLVIDIESELKELLHT